jgi:two-component system, chemotaxis family, CheB/CheR fusion protein
MPVSRPPRVALSGNGAAVQSGNQTTSNTKAPSGPLRFCVAGIGASAGGLDACRRLVAAVPDRSGVAFILVQYLDETHASMMPDLLATCTKLHVQQASDGMRIAPDHLYVIPPGFYLSVREGQLHLSPPGARHGAQMPFDFLLHSMAAEFGPRAVCVVLSGTATDGSLGLKSIKERGGLVIVQRPDEAGFDGMPLSAIRMDTVDAVLPAAEIPAAIISYAAAPRHVSEPPLAGTATDPAPAWLTKIIELLRQQTVHDFRFYKQGTLKRRIERRMAMSSVSAGQGDRYLELLEDDAGEVALLAKDLLINVTRFFRDKTVFDLLATTIIPELVEKQNQNLPLRVWISGCSSGEEAYSLAMVFREAIAATRRNVKLQVFASDVDPDAVAFARAGLYPLDIAHDVSADRLQHFFVREDNGYRVTPELRTSITFTIQDVLVDLPLSRLDFVSCRNLLIYLTPEAQTKVIGLFRFALRDGGILLLGGTETLGNFDGRFEVVSKTERIYRHIGRARPGDIGDLAGGTDGVRLPARQGNGLGQSRQAALMDMCRRYVLDIHAPAAVLINRRQECLYSLGPINKYLRLVAGHPHTDILAMAHDGVRNRLRTVIQQALQTNRRSITPGGHINQEGAATSFNIDVLPLVADGEALLLVYFVEDALITGKPPKDSVPGDQSRIGELEQELDAKRTELQDTIRSLEYSSEKQRAINEEALSINEEYQSTNEELLTSKEELQSRNKELAALNGQLQDTLGRQRATANDLQNVLYSTDVATLFLDGDLKIRFFTPATRFNVISSDIGRPLADLHSLSADRALTEDARGVLRTLTPVECEIETQAGAWFMRRVSPYRTIEKGIEGVVITFADITEQRRIAAALEAARQQSERATIAKSRFLAAASHDLRQPLQTLVLLQGLLAKAVSGEKAQKLVVRLDETLSAMTGMLDALLDINRIDAGTVRAEMVDFAMNEVLDRMRAEFAFHAQAKRLCFRVARCGAIVRGDPVLVEQMLRNLLSNALKYTQHGKVLLGCRHQHDGVRVEVWDTGIGIPHSEIPSIFEEYHQLDNAACERSQGLGLGLSIVRRLGRLLGTEVHVRSRPRLGSVFAFDLKRAAVGIVPPPARASETMPTPSEMPKSMAGQALTGSILVVEDDSELRDLLEVFLKAEGHQTATAAHGIAALQMVALGEFRPDLVLADYNLPNHMDGLRLIAKLRSQLQRQLPVVILTGDISTEALREIAAQDCAQLNKPVKLPELTAAIQRSLASIKQPSARPAERTAQLHEPAELAPMIYVVDDDDTVRGAIRQTLEDDGRVVEDYATCEAFLSGFNPASTACILIDAFLPGMSGLELLQHLRTNGHQLPAIMITGQSDVSVAVHAMKAGAIDFIEKPVSRIDLLECIDRALEQARGGSKAAAWRVSAASQIAGLTLRERQIMDLVLAGHPSKNIAADLEISQRTVENHRASIMKKTGTKSLPALARLALAAAVRGAEL